MDEGSSLAPTEEIRVITKSPKRRWIRPLKKKYKEKTSALVPNQSPLKKVSSHWEEKSESKKRKSWKGKLKPFKRSPFKGKLKTKSYGTFGSSDNAREALNSPEKYESNFQNLENNETMHDEVKIFVEDYDEIYNTDTLNRMDVLRRKKLLRKPAVISDGWDDVAERRISMSVGDLREETMSASDRESDLSDDQRSVSEIDTNVARKRRSKRRFLRRRRTEGTVYQKLGSINASLLGVGIANMAEDGEKGNFRSNILSKSRGKYRSQSFSSVEDFLLHLSHEERDNRPSRKSFKKSFLRRGRRGTKYETIPDSPQKVNTQDLIKGMEEVQSDMMDHAKALLERGDDLEQLLQASQELEEASERFEKTSKATAFKLFCHSCCPCCRCA